MRMLSVSSSWRSNWACRSRRASKISSTCLRSLTNSLSRRRSNRSAFRKCTRQHKRCVKSVKSSKRRTRSALKTLNRRIRSSTWQICMSSDALFLRRCRRERSKEKRLRKEAQRQHSGGCKWLQLLVVKKNLKREGRREGLHRMPNLWCLSEKMVTMTLVWQMRIGMCTEKSRKTASVRTRKKTSQTLLNLRTKSLISIQSFSCCYTAPRRCQQLKTFRSGSGLIDSEAQRFFSSRRSLDWKVKAWVRSSRTCLASLEELIRASRSRIQRTKYWVETSDETFFHTCYWLAETRRFQTSIIECCRNWGCSIHLSSQSML